MRMIIVYTLCMTSPVPPNNANPPVTQVPAAPARISSAALFKDALEIEIEHRGALYRLRETKLGKLILTK